jgi:putative thiamine transport system permease protein
MAKTIRRVVYRLGWLVVAIVAGLPLFGVTISLWPTVPISWADVTRFSDYNGIGPSIMYSLFVALIAPLIGFYVAFMVYTQYRFHRRWQQLEQRLAPLLSLPHLAIALGLVYLFGTGGIVWTAIGEWISSTLLSSIGLPRKGLATVIIAISIKEVPFFLLILSAIGRQLPIKIWLLQGRALGYTEAASWWLLVLPSMLKQSRLALLAAMAYCVSVLDVSLLIGPNVPSLYSVVLYGWQTSFSTPDQTHAFIGNVVLLLMLSALIATLYAHEWLIVQRLKVAAVMAKSLKIAGLNKLFVIWLAFFSLLTLAILITFFLWSLGWGKPSDTSLSFSLWREEWFFLQGPLLSSFKIAGLSSLLGLSVALCALELQHQKQRFLPDYVWLMAILLPQLSVVYGWQIAHTEISGGYHIAWIILSHTPFTFAYSYLVMRGPFQSLDKHYELIAASMGYTYWQRWWKIRFSLLRPALLSALAIAFSVSIAQYVPTIMIGAGRIATITTESISIASGNEQGITALYMLMQAALPFIAFLVASILAYRFRGSFDAKYH